MVKILVLFLLLPFILGGAPSRTYTYTSGNVINPDEVTTNEDNVFSYLQAGVDTIRDDSVTTDTIVDGTIATADLGNSIVTSAKIYDGTIANADLADSAVDSAKIQNGTVSGSDLASTLSGSFTISTTGNATVSGLTVSNFTDSTGSKGAKDYVLTTQDVAGATKYVDLSTISTTEIYIGTFTRDTETASSEQIISGVGFEPSVVIFFTVEDGSTEISWGFDDGSTSYSIYQTQTAGTFGQGNPFATNKSIADVESTAGDDYYVGEITAMNSDGFVINWTRTGTPSGNIVVYYLAIR